MIRRLLAWLGIAPARGAAIYPRPYGAEMVWHWQCYECRSGSGVAPSYKVALNAAQTHQRTQHAEYTAKRRAGRRPVAACPNCELRGFVADACPVCLGRGHIVEREGLE